LKNRGELIFPKIIFGGIDRSISELLERFKDEKGSLHIIWEH